MLLRQKEGGVRLSQISRDGGRGEPTPKQVPEQQTGKECGWPRHHATAGRYSPRSVDIRQVRTPTPFAVPKTWGALREGLGRDRERVWIWADSFATLSSHEEGESSPEVQQQLKQVPHVTHPLERRWEGWSHSTVGRGLASGPPDSSPNTPEVPQTPPGLIPEH